MTVTQSTLPTLDSLDLQAGAPTRDDDDVSARTAGKLDSPWRIQLEAAMHQSRQAHRVQHVREDVSALFVRRVWTIGQFFWTG